MEAGIFRATASLYLPQADSTRRSSHDGVSAGTRNGRVTSASGTSDTAGNQADFAGEVDGFNRRNTAAQIGTQVIAKHPDQTANGGSADAGATGDDAIRDQRLRKIWRHTATHPTKKAARHNAGGALVHPNTSRKQTPSGSHRSLGGTRNFARVSLRSPSNITFARGLTPLVPRSFNGSSEGFWLYTARRRGHHVEAPR
ncbi:hypothetical protein CCANI_06380 [Corynebacterium canis]|nr:hypothetical protein CCANI_06380 [Corynebacterium canis]